MKTVAIALPGREFSGNFLKNWSQTLLQLTQIHWPYYSDARST